MGSRSNVSLSDNLAVGEYGTLYNGGTSQSVAADGTVFYRIDVVATATFSEITADASAPITGTMTSVAFPTPFSLFGKFASFTLTSGKVVAYSKPILS